MAEHNASRVVATTTKTPTLHHPFQRCRACYDHHQLQILHCGSLDSSPLIANVSKSPAAMYAREVFGSRISPPPDFAAPARPTSSYRGSDDSVCFSGGTSHESFTGQLEDGSKLCMTEQQAKDFILYKDADLYHRLTGRSKAPSIFNTRQPIEKSRNSIPLAPLKPMPFTSKGQENPPKAKQHNQPPWNLLQFKRRVISGLIDGQVLVVQKMAMSYTAHCSQPNCYCSIQAIPPGRFVLQLKGKDDSLVADHALLCLMCAENVFEPEVKQVAVMSTLPTSAVGSLDGTSELLEAALRLEVSKDRMDMIKVAGEAREIEFPFNHPSNSAQAILLRQQRSAETQEILQHVEKYEKRCQEQAQSNAGSSSLRIVPPPAVGRISDRYRKQGLTETAKRKEIKENRLSGGEKRDRTSSSSESTVASESLPICSCGEPGDLRYVVKCCSNLCLIGSFHLDCAGLEDMPEDLWYCDGCNEYFQYSPHLALSLEEDGECDYDGDEDEEIDKLEDGLEGDAEVESCDEDMLENADDEWCKDLEDPPCNGFTAINRTSVSNYHLDGPQSNCVNQESTAQRALLAVAAACTFSDLAPFIVPETYLTSLRALLPAHVDALEEWKAKCPPSQLLMNLKLALKNADATGNVPAIPKSDIAVEKLSHVLAQVDLPNVRMDRDFQ